MATMQAVDCFPSHVLDDPDQWIDYNLNFKDLRDRFSSQSKPFVSWIPQNDNPKQKLYYKFTDKSKAIHAHEMWCLKRAETTRELEPVSWQKIHKKLSHSIKLDSTNTDRRMCFRYGNVFLTKAYFTFGYRTVPENCYHLYQTGKNPIWLFKQKTLTPQNKCMAQRSFDVSFRYDFDKWVMCPDSLYYLPPGTSYVLITSQKSLFAVHSVSKRTWKKLKPQHSFSKVTETTYSPLRRVMKRKLDSDFDYYLPPATPAMDTIHDFYVSPPHRREEEEEMPPDFTPDATSFFTSTQKKRKASFKVDLDGFKLPFLPPSTVSHPIQEPCVETNSEPCSPPILNSETCSMEQSQTLNLESHIVNSETHSREQSQISNLESHILNSETHSMEQSQISNLESHILNSETHSSHISDMVYYLYEPLLTTQNVQYPHITNPVVNDDLDFIFKDLDISIPTQLPSDEELLNAIEEVLNLPNPETFFNPPNPPQETPQTLNYPQETLNFPQETLNLNFPQETLNLNFPQETSQNLNSQQDTLTPQNLNFPQETLNYQQGTLNPQHFNYSQQSFYPQHYNPYLENTQPPDLPLDLLGDIFE